MRECVCADATPACTCAFHLTRFTPVSLKTSGQTTGSTVLHCVCAADSPKAALEVGLVAFAVSETGTGRLGSADTAAVDAAVHLWLVEAKHLCQHRSQLNNEDAALLNTLLRRSNLL